MIITTHELDQTMNAHTNNKFERTQTLLSRPTNSFVHTRDRSAAMLSHATSRCACRKFALASNSRYEAQNRDSRRGNVSNHEDTAVIASRHCAVLEPVFVPNAFKQRCQPLAMWRVHGDTCEVHRPNEQVAKSIECELRSRVIHQLKAELTNKTSVLIKHLQTKKSNLRNQHNEQQEHQLTLTQSRAPMKISSLCTAKRP